MAAMPETNQTIARLTPLAEVLAAVDAAAKPVAARDVDVAAARRPRARGRRRRAQALPSGGHGFAGRLGGRTPRRHVDAGGYAPVHCRRRRRSAIEAGQPMPHGTDAVAPFDAMKVSGGPRRSAGRCHAGRRRAGGRRRLRPRAFRCGRPASGCATVDLAVFAAPALRTSSVREPRLSVVPLREDSIIDRRRRSWSRATSSGAAAGTADEPAAISTRAGDGKRRRHRRRSAAPAAAATTRACRRWRAPAASPCTALRLTPGETAAFGFAGPRPVLLLPGRLDAALAVWLTLGRRMLARLAGSTREASKSRRDCRWRARSRPPWAWPNSCRCAATATRLEPLATKYLPLPRWRRPTAGSWCRPKAKAMPPARRFT